VHSQNPFRVKGFGVFGGHRSHLAYAPNPLPFLTFLADPTVYTFLDSFFILLERNGTPVTVELTSAG
jgi:hypothetical protein